MWTVALIAMIAAPPPEGVRRVVAARDAAQVAWLDLSANVPRERQPYQWYVWNNTGLGNAGTIESAAALNFLANAVLSQSGAMIDPAFVIAEDWQALTRGDRPEKPNITNVNPSPGKLRAPLLLRYDLTFLVSQKKDFDRLWRELQKLAEVEPYFHQPSEPASGAASARRGTRLAGTHLTGARRADASTLAAGYEWVRITVPQYLASDGQYYEHKWIERPIVRRVELGLHAGAGGPLSLLADQAGHNLLPIVRGDWLVATAWDSQTIDGVKGSYYQLAGIGDTLDQFLEQAGADPRLVAKLRSDQRAAMISGVTGKWRQVEAFFGTGVRPEFGPSLITITHDIQDKEGDAKRHAFLNLLKFEDQAREAIAAKRNGLHAFLLTNGQGKRQDAAPPDVASWPESPHKTKNLTAGISCLQCHGSSRGYNDTQNDVREMIRLGLAPVADLTVELDDAASGAAPARRATRRPDGSTLATITGAEVQELLRSKYDGELNLPLKLAGNAYAAAVDRATWGLFGERSVERVSAETVRMYREYHEPVTPERLLRELGYELVPGERRGVSPPSHARQADASTLAALALKQIVPAVADEDGRIGLARLGRKILRSDVHEIFYEMALRDVLRD